MTPCFQITHKGAAVSGFELPDGRYRAEWWGSRVTFWIGETEYASQAKGWPDGGKIKNTEVIVSGGDVMVEGYVYSEADW